MAAAAAAPTSSSGNRFAEFLRDFVPDLEMTAGEAATLRRVRLGIEFIALYVMLPLVIFFDWIPGLPPFAVLWGAAAACFVYLFWFAPDFDRREFTRVDFFRNPRQMALVLLPFVLLASAVGLLVAIFTPELLFNFPRQNLLVWAIVMIAYPLLSVVPQVIVYRSFLLYRYRELFPQKWALWLVAAAAFAFVHIIFRNPIAVGLTALGGLLFIGTYLRTRSIWASAFEHALYGCWIMTIGWGVYLYYGANQHDDSMADSVDGIGELIMPIREARHNAIMPRIESDPPAPAFLAAGDRETVPADPTRPAASPGETRTASNSGVSASASTASTVKIAFASARNVAAWAGSSPPAASLQAQHVHPSPNVELVTDGEASAAAVSASAEQ